MDEGERERESQYKRTASSNSGENLVTTRVVKSLCEDARVSQNLKGDRLAVNICA